MKLDLFQRWTLSNQMAILGKFEPENADFYQRAKTALERGYEREYRELYSHLDEGLRDEECLEVFDILSMFEAIDDALTELPNLDVDKTWLKFHGFDGNTEARLVGYVSFVCDPTAVPRNYESLNLTEFNSHMPTLPIYRRQLEAWREGKNKRDLSGEDCRRIAAAARPRD